ncbi:hypothetical protein [Mycolicibacterium wolinskyi]|uniref:hypothetical protein n=1 Tax=Mycolicibacterium wolinskyi TaxID=59750 RepID=UPI003917906C
MTDDDDSWDDIIDAAGEQVDKIRITIASRYEEDSPLFVGPEAPLLEAENGSRRLLAAYVELPCGTQRVNRSALSERIRKLAAATADESAPTPPATNVHTEVIPSGGGFFADQALQFVIDLGDNAWDGIVGALAYDWLMRARQKLAKPLKVPEAEVKLLRHQEAIQKGQDAIAERFETAKDELGPGPAVIGESSVSIVFTTKDKAKTFVVHFEMDTAGNTEITVMQL